MYNVHVHCKGRHKASAHIQSRTMKKHSTGFESALFHVQCTCTCVYIIPWLVCNHVHVDECVHLPMYILHVYCVCSVFGCSLLLNDSSDTSYMYTCTKCLSCYQTCQVHVLVRFCLGTQAAFQVSLHVHTLKALSHDIRTIFSTLRHSTPLLPRPID